MDSRPTPVPGTTYRPAPLASLPETLDMNYYQWTPERKLLEAKRLAIRARLKREYLLKLNDPNRIAMIQDPAVVRWNNARIYGPTQHSSAKPKASLMGVIFALGPFVLSYYAIKTSRERKENLIREGKYDRPYHYIY
ncbi:NADH dehydrogenase [ubiquinone] 1 beta subcomplex subunit 4 [Pogona vitticeps]|uniref:NADH dehydrogenase [ubiquinone] 1 beta subcomplex subunit 4 n=1 Tax=Pogona vitticeps TaxID=103695 RepID=A0A6J0TDR8_9SAUR